MGRELLLSDDTKVAVLSSTPTLNGQSLLLAVLYISAAVMSVLSFSLTLHSAFQIEIQSEWDFLFSFSEHFVVDVAQYGT
ncbi:unnamed protein product [Ilex paraguariensis]|uniref:CASP-like protein n=1 Tax=Ilex paraguariensis TaxID=185542 RepID=A0ABC8R292_9AQUA